MPEPADAADYRENAGTVHWPATPDALTDTTKCPACFTPLLTTVCRTCGLDVTHPAAIELAEASHSAAAALARRIELIGRMRYDASQNRVTVQTAHIPADAAVVSQADKPIAAPNPIGATPTAEPLNLTPPNTPSSAPAPGVATAKPRRSSVQVALLIAGVSLLSVFAVFFLVYAFITYGILWRSVIIAAITVAAFVSASLLRRRALTASAEGLAVFAIVLVYLDAYALRANDFFGLGTLDETAYWGAVFTVSSVGFVIWHRVSRVRAASIVGWATLAPGVGLLVWGLADGAEPATRAFVAVVAAAATSGLVHTLVPRGAFAGTFERILVLGTAFASLITAFMVSWAVDPVADWAGAAAISLVAVLGLVLAAVAAAGRTSTAMVRAFARIFAAIGGAAAASVVAAAAVRRLPDDLDFAMLWPVVTAAAVTLALEAVASGIAHRELRRVAVVAAWGGAGVLALTALLPLSTAVTPIVLGLLDALRSTWAASAAAPIATVSSSGLAVLALAIVLTLAAATWAGMGRLIRRGPALAWGGAVVLTLAAAQLPTLWLTLTAWLVLSASAFLLLWRSRSGADSPYRASLVGTVTAATALMFAAGWMSLDTWGMATAATVVVLAACRLLNRAATARAALLGAALVLTFAGLAAAGLALNWRTPLPADVDAVNSSTLVVFAAAAALGLSAFALPPASVSPLDRRTMFWVSGAAAASAAVTAFTLLTRSGGGTPPGLLLPQFATSLVSSLLLLGALLLWVGLRANLLLRGERIAASIALGPALFWVVDSFARVLGVNDFAQAVVPVTAALLAAAGALGVTLLRPSTSSRWARELGVAAVGLPAVLSAVAEREAAGWLVLLIAAITVLLLAIDRDGLFSSRAPRRQLGWVALGLATAGVWWRLRSDQIDAVEPYVLPLAAALLVVAYFIDRAAAKADAGAPSKAAPLVALAGLLIGLLPVAANAISGELARAIVIAAVSATLLLAGSLVDVGGRLRRYLDVAALAGGIGLIVTAAGRALQSSPNGLTLDAWVAALFVLLVTAGFGQARLRPDAGTRWRNLASQTLGVMAIFAFAIESTGFSDLTLGTVRALACVALLGALHVVARLVDHPPLSPLIGLTAISVSAGIAVVGLASDALDPIELATVPIAVALLASGTIRLSRESSLRSWRALGPGIAILLVPSLMVSVDSPELWRLVALGVASVTVLIAGAVRRLQAPFVLGLAVALVHGFATFAPQIRAVYESQEWWFWAGIAGVLLLILAVRYERRIQNFREVVMRIGALR